ncbi:MAG: hypothetical protein QOG92_664 [Verrucomicrobiota bacterium]|nr:hypothetical protein [Verrucomicrobiota bacterium]
MGNSTRHRGNIAFQPGADLAETGKSQVTLAAFNTPKIAAVYSVLA